MRSACFIAINSGPPLQVGMDSKDKEGGTMGVEGGGQGGTMGQGTRQATHINAWARCSTPLPSSRRPLPPGRGTHLQASRLCVEALDIMDNRSGCRNLSLRRVLAVSRCYVFQPGAYRYTASHCQSSSERQFRDPNRTRLEDKLRDTDGTRLEDEFRDPDRVYIMTSELVTEAYVLKILVSMKVVRTKADLGRHPASPKSVNGGGQMNSSLRHSPI